jgi:RNA polymerase sigma factor (sigma-70 family)
MRCAGVDDVSLVVAARSGNTRARDELIAGYLPLVYNVVGRALAGHADVDDVVQETLLLAVRDLPDLRAPESFRSWLVAIAMRQVIAYRQRDRAAADRTAAWRDADQVPDRGALEDEAILRLHVSDQRRQVAEASRWLDPGFRSLLSLWWQEKAGWLSRGEVAAASGMTVAHAGVRLQRLREQLEVARAVIAALAADPRCPELGTAIASWDGSRTPVWRKRIARHTGGCPYCAAAAAGQVPAERLLTSIPALAVPAGLTAALAARGLLPAPLPGVPGEAPVPRPATAPAHAIRPGRGLHRPLASRAAHAVAAHPVAVLTAGAAIVGCAAVTYAARPEPTQRAPQTTVTVAPPVVAAPAVTAKAPATKPARERPTAQASPSAPAGAVPLGAWSLESVAEPGRYLTYAGTYATLGQVSASSTGQARQQATFTVVAGLADSRCVSFVAADGDYLRHYELRLQLSPADSTGLFPKDATFCPHPGAVDGSVTLQSYNYPYLVLRYLNGAIYINVPDGTRAFASESSFIVRAPWAP